MRTLFFLLTAITGFIAYCAEKINMETAILILIVLWALGVLKDIHDEHKKKS